MPLGVNSWASGLQMVETKEFTDPCGWWWISVKEIAVSPYLIPEMQMVTCGNADRCF